MPNKSSSKASCRGEVIDVDFSIGAVIPGRKVDDVHIELSDIFAALNLGSVERGSNFRCGFGRKTPYLSRRWNRAMTLNAADGLGNVCDSLTRTDGGES